jgi:aryl-phospho-beta-D-glucosidase BglC (GH1 family)
MVAGALVTASTAAEAVTLHRLSASPIATPTTMSSPPWSGNLLKGDRATFDHSAGGWVGTDKVTVHRVAQPRQAGTGSLAIINTSRNIGVASASVGKTSATHLPVVPGDRYAMNFWVLASVNAGRGVSGEISFLDATGHEFEPAYGMRNTDTYKAWTRVTDTVAIAPPAAKYLVVRVLIYNSAPTETHFVDTVTVAHAKGSSRNVVGPLHTSGNKVIDGNGQPIRLRGVVRVGMQTGPIAPTVSVDDISHAKGWGANIVRLPVGSQLWLDPSYGTCHTDPNYASKVDNAVNIITGMGMYVMLDLHWNTIAPCGPAKPYAMADYPNSISFWQQVATRYKSNPLVGFDLYNEPHNISDQVWRFGGTVTWKGVTYQAAGMQQMYDAIRGTGATNLVFATGTVWGNNFPSTAPLAGNNIVYSAHSYTCPGSPPPKCTTSTTPYDGSTYLKNWVVPGQHYPVLVGEFGWPSPGSGRYNQSLISYDEDHGWGWTIFTWGNNTKSRFALISEGWGTAYEPAPSGMPALEAFPGT